MKTIDSKAAERGMPELLSTYTFSDDLTQQEMRTLASKAEDKIKTLASGLRGLGMAMAALEPDQCPSDEMCHVWELVSELGEQIERLNTARSNLTCHIEQQGSGRALQ